MTADVTPNPFRGWLRPLWWLDDRLHRSGRTWRRLCDYVDRKVLDG